MVSGEVQSSVVHVQYKLTRKPGRQLEKQIDRYTGMQAGKQVARYTEGVQNTQIYIKNLFSEILDTLKTDRKTSKACSSNHSCDKNMDTRQ